MGSETGPLARGRAWVVGLLLERGAEPSLTWENGETTVDIAAQEGHDAIAERLRRHILHGRAGGRLD